MTMATILFHLNKLHLVKTIERNMKYLHDDRKKVGHSAKDIEKSQNEYESKRPIAVSRKQITLCTERSLSMG